jgi:glutamate 5-kinase
MRRGEPIALVKYGSRTVTNGTGMDIERLDEYAQQVARLRETYDVVIVSSGAIVTGRAIAATRGIATNSANYAAIGAPRAFMAWQEALAAHDITSGAMSVTNHEINSPEGKVLRRRLFSMLNKDIVPVLNGNDALSDEGTKELKIDSDNDRLAGHVAELVGAQQLLLLTGKPGVLDGEGKVVKHAGLHNLDTLYKFVTEVEPSAQDNDYGERGGMGSKISVAFDFAHDLLLRRDYPPGSAHIATATADLKDVIRDGEGTHFAPYA